MRRRRVWSEFLPPNELAAPATVRLLRRFSLEPIVAVPPHAENADLARALSVLSAAGLRLGLWPLLHDDDGYWPSERNVELFLARVDRVLAFADEAGAGIRTVAIDLEPPLSLLKKVSSGSRRDRFSAGVQLFKDARNQRLRRGETTDAFAALHDRLLTLGKETLVAAVPPVAIDLVSGRNFCQAVLQTPALCHGEAVVSLMMYTRIVADLLPGAGTKDARSLLFLAARALASRGRGSISLGPVGVGKLEDEPVMDSPEELRAEVALARAAGIDDLALFSLDGVLGRDRPEAWLSAFVDDDGVAEIPRRVAPMRLGLFALARLSRLAAPWLE